LMFMPFSAAKAKQLNLRISSKLLAKSISKGWRLGLSPSLCCLTNSREIMRYPAHKVCTSTPVSNFAENLTKNDCIV